MELVRIYIENGFKLIPLKHGTKLPLERGWESKTYTNPKPWKTHPDSGVGVHLGESGLISLDIDSPEDFQKILDEFGFDIPETLKITGRNPRYIYKSSNKIYKNLSIKNKCIFEIRAGNHYDCLPPTIHPQTLKPYELEGSVDAIAEAPAWIEILVNNWGDFKPQLLDAVAGTQDALEIRATLPLCASSDSVSSKYCAENSLPETLKRYGYKQKSGKRWLSPHSSTGIAGVYMIDQDRCWIHHASDPLCSNSTGRPVNSFDLFVQAEHGGDYKAAYKATGEKSVGKRRGRKPKSESSQDQEIIDHEPAQVEAAPFKFLGYDPESVYVLPRLVGAVVSIKISSMKKMNLIQIAPLDYWAINFPSKTSIDWDSAFNFLVENSYAAGSYDPSKVRGVGAWFDAGKTVIHCGQSIIENGERLDVTESTGKYIYEKKIGISDISDKKLTAEQSSGVADLLSRLNFETDYDAKLLAGFSALAPICGALEWRPHVWLSASRGSGKTWIQSNILAPLIGDIGLNVQGSTTEAGLRQFLSSDARPVMFDEAESENVAAQDRMQRIIELARQASSDSSAVVVKGTVSGSCVKFLPRSMFLMSSINSSLRQSADLSRFTMINLKGKSKEFKEINIAANNLLTDEYCAAFRRRMFDMVPIIRQNAKNIAEKIAEIKNDRRLGDQLGALIAGYIAIKTDRVISAEEAEALAQDFVFFSNKEPSDDEETDEKQVLNHILQTKVRSENIDRTVGELVEICAEKRVDEKIGSRLSRDILGRHGIRIESGEIWIANNNAELRKLLNGTAWAANWKKLLCRIEGAEKCEKPALFSGCTQRYTAIKLEALYSKT